MEKIGFIIGEEFVYWSPIILAISVVAAVCAFLALYSFSTGKLLGALLISALSVGLCPVFGRFVEWYCLPDSFESLSAAMSDFTSGGYALTGIFAGCLVAACLVRLAGGIKNLPQTLDCMAIAGCLGICVGRLNHLFNHLDRGQVMTGSTSLPLVYPVENSTSGEPEYRLATFMLQSIVAGILFIALLAYFLQSRVRKTQRHGDTFLLFLLGSGGSQILLDSTRYDSLFLRSNGFVSMVMILGAIGLVLAIVLFSIRLVKNRGWRWWYLAPWVGIVGLLTCAGIMEYLVQRRSNQALFFYNIMFICLVLVIAIALGIRLLAGQKKRRKPKYA